MITIILFNSALELAKELGNDRLKHQAFVNDRTRRKKKDAGEILLDIAVHYSAMKPEERVNRGRPDILHQILLQYHFSLLNNNYIKEKNLKNEVNGYRMQFSPLNLIIHTRSDKIIEIPPSWRVPVSYLRFRGLMEQLLVEGQIKKPSIKVRDNTLDKLISTLTYDKLILWSHTGNPLNRLELKQDIKNYYADNRSIVWLIGGYQHGEPDLKITKKLTNIFRITEYVLTAWKTFQILLQLCEMEILNVY